MDALRFPTRRFAARGVYNNMVLPVNAQALQGYPDASCAICGAEHPRIPVTRACSCRKVYCRDCIIPSLNRGDPCPTCRNLFVPNLGTHLMRPGLDSGPMDMLLTLVCLLAGGVLAGHSNGFPHLALFAMEICFANLLNALRADELASNSVHHLVAIVLMIVVGSSFMLMLKLVNRYPAIAPANGLLRPGRTRSCMKAMERLCCGIVIGLALFAYAKLEASGMETSTQLLVTPFVYLFTALHVQTVLRSVARRLAAETHQ